MFLLKIYHKKAPNDQGYAKNFVNFQPKEPQRGSIMRNPVRLRAGDKKIAG
ncbi:hypothetical protein NUS56_00705 [Glaesserella parasuis]|nr:hypothetical protein [Glaesserella parasuis]MDE4012091.1 hypothetical protein [Glaesserella parasuis]